MKTAFTVQRIDKGHVEIEPEEIYDEWEDMTDNHGEPEKLLDGVWVVKAERDKEWHGYKYGDPIFLVTRTRLHR